MQTPTELVSAPDGTWGPGAGVPVLELIVSRGGNRQEATHRLMGKLRVRAETCPGHKAEQAEGVGWAAADSSRVDRPACLQERAGLATRWWEVGGRAEGRWRGASCSLAVKVGAFGWHAGTLHKSGCYTENRLEGPGSPGGGAAGGWGPGHSPSSHSAAGGGTRGGGSKGDRGFGPTCHRAQVGEEGQRLGLYPGAASELGWRLTAGPVASSLGPVPRGRLGEVWAAPWDGGRD